MSAKDLAQSKKLESQAARVDKAIARNTEQQTELAPTIFEGHDPNTGTSKIRKIGGNPVIGGDRITHGTPQEGDLVLSRPTQGKTRVDKRSPRHTSIECGGTGAPNPRLRGTGIPGGQGDDPLINDVIDNPPAKVPTGRFNERCVGFALVYEEYTGAVDEAGNFTTRTVTVPNSPQCTSKVKPFSPLSPNDNGCYRPSANVNNRCQWFDVATEADAIAGTGTPEGMIYTGYIEYPEASFRIMACVENGAAPVEGIGCGWRPENQPEPQVQTGTIIRLLVRFPPSVVYHCGIVLRTNVSFVREINPTNPAYNVAYYQHPRYPNLPTSGCSDPLPFFTYFGIFDITTEWHMLFDSDQGQFSIRVASNNTFPFNSVTFEPYYD
jgi:hypothetical protein